MIVLGRLARSVLFPVEGWADVRSSAFAPDQRRPVPVGGGAALASGVSFPMVLMGPPGGDGEGVTAIGAALWDCFS